MLKAAISRLAKGSMVYGVGGMLQRFIGLLLLPFFTHVLTPEDYGVVALITLISVAMNGLFTLGTGNSMGVIYYREKDETKRPTVIWTNALLMLLNCTIWYSLIYFSAPILSELMFQSEHYGDLIRLALLGAVFSTIAGPWLSYLRMEEKAKQYVVLTLSSSLLSILLSIWFVLFLRIGVFGLLLAGTLSQAFMLFLNRLVIGSKLPFSIDIRLFGPLVRIGFPSIFGLFAFLLIDYSDRQMIERMVSLDALGVYSVGYSFGMVMTIAMGAFASAWPPFFMSYLHKRDEARLVFARVLTYYLVGVGVLIVLFFYMAKPVVYLMTAPAFHEASLVVGLVAAAYMLKGCYLIVLPGVYFAEKLHRQSAVEWIAAIVNISLNLLLIPIYGIVGAALATLISYMTLPVLAWFVSKHYLEVDYEWRRVVMTVCTVVISSYLLYWLPDSLNQGLLINLLGNTVVLLCFFGVVYWLLFTVYERKQIRKKLRS